MKDQHNIYFSLSKNDHCEKTKAESLEPYILRYLGAAGSKSLPFSFSNYTIRSSSAAHVFHRKHVSIEVKAQNSS